VRRSISTPIAHPVRADGSFPPQEPGSEVRHVTGGVPTAREGRAARAFLSKVPVVIAERVPQSRLDSRLGFVLSLLDGSTTVEDVLDLSGMSNDETLGLLEELRLRGVIRL
jgi:hypothetical protein